MEQKIIECINNDCIPGIGPKVKTHLTVGKQYKSKEYGDFYELKDDTNLITSYHKSRFKEVEESSPQQEVEYYEVIKKVPFMEFNIGDRLPIPPFKDEFAQYPEFFKPHYKAQYKAGDWVIAHAESKLGSKTFQVVHVDSTHVWNGDPTKSNPIGYGLQNVRHATAEEIEAASTITIGGYKVEIDKEWVKIGCKSFTSREIIAYKSLLDNGVTIVYKGEQITLDKLNQILDKLK